MFPGATVQVQYCTVPVQYCIRHVSLMGESTMRIGTQGIVGVWLVILFSFDKMASVGCQTTWQSFDPVFGLATPPSPPTPSVTKSPFWRKGRPTAMFAHGSAPLGRTAVCLTGQPRALGGILGKDVLSAQHRSSAVKVLVGRVVEHDQHGNHVVWLLRAFPHEPVWMFRPNMNEQVCTAVRFGNCS